MAFFRKKKKSTLLLPLLEEIKNNADKNRYSVLFVKLIAALRPGKKEQAEIHIQQLLDCIENDNTLRLKLQLMFAELFHTRDSQSIFTSVGILESGTFFTEFFRQIRHSILPPIAEKRSLNYLLESAFNRKDDYIWVSKVPDELWISFFKMIAGGLNKMDNNLINSLTDTLIILSYRVSYLGLEKEMGNQLKTELEANIPFIEQNKKIQTLVHLLKSGDAPEAFLQQTSMEAIGLLNECEKIIANIRANTDKHGTSLSQSYLVQRCSQQIKRIFIIIRFITPGALPQHSLINMVSLFKSIVESINKRNSIIDLYRKNTGMLAYQVAEHKSASGEHLITTSRPEYIALFFSAAGCGIIISFAAFIKVLLQKMHIADFWQYFAYSLNYAIAFIIIYLTGATLATKQPAMTASVLASSLDGRKGGVSLQGLALSFARVWRSQFICFLGNLAVVFPMAYLISFAYEYIVGIPLMNTKESTQSIEDQNPINSLALYYGALTGVCLFLSGIISGYMDNKVIYSNIKRRLKQSPNMRQVFGPKKLSRMADFIAHNSGGILGYVSLGFMLGYSTLIGKFFGFPFDTRHVTISTAYYGFGVEGLGNHLTQYQWIWTTLGIIGIGFFNFLISFGMAFYVAVRSRNVPFSSLPTVAKLIGKYLIKYPLDFIYPPKTERKEKNVFE